MSPDIFDIPYSSDINLTEQKKEKQIIQELIATLTHELFSELIIIDEKRQNMIDIITENPSNLHKIKGNDLKDLDVVSET